MDALKKSGMGTELRNSIFHWIRSHSNHSHNQHSKESLAYLRKAQMQWEKRIYKSLNSMSNELGVPLSRFRLASDKDELEEKWTELSTYDVDLSQYRPVYAPKDFLDVLLAIRSPNYNLIKYVLISLLSFMNIARYYCLLKNYVYFMLYKNSRIKTNIVRGLIS